ncbi:MAG TPA: hypothetical protein VFZ32_06615 [Micromonosporaceae bacterium]
MLGRTKEKVTEKRIGGELHEGLDHFRSAASLAAGRAAERIAPAVDSARASTREIVAPRVEHAREAASRAWETRMQRSAQATKKQARSAEKLSRRARRKAQRASMDANRLGRRAAVRRRATDVAPPRRGRWMLGALGVGAALGAVSAMVRKRKAPEWEDYEPMERGDAVEEKVTDMEAARRRTGTVVETPGPGQAGEPPGRHYAGEPDLGPPAPPVTGPTVEPSSVRTPEDRPPGM